MSDNNLNGLAYYYEGTGDPAYENIITSVIPGFALLIGSGIPVSGEFDSRLTTLD